MEFNRHTTVVGLTQEGKTYTTTKSLLKTREGVLFVNTKLDDMPVSGFTMTDGSVSFEQIYRLLQKGRKVAFNPSRDKAARSRQLSYIINQIYDKGKRDLILAVDEVHLYDNKAVEKMEEVATTGLSLGYKAIWISQRYANISNTLMTQSDQHVIFRTVMEEGYFKRYGMPFEAIEGMLASGGQYHYVTYDFKTLMGPFKA